MLKWQWYSENIEKIPWDRFKKVQKLPSTKQELLRHKPTLNFWPILHLSFKNLSAVHCSKTPFRDIHCKLDQKTYNQRDIKVLQSGDWIHCGENQDSSLTKKSKKSRPNPDYQTVLPKLLPYISKNIMFWHLIAQFTE